MCQLEEGEATQMGMQGSAHALFLCQVYGSWMGCGIVAAEKGTIVSYKFDIAGTMRASRAPSFLYGLHYMRTRERVQ